jgi:hypothetical protein
MEDASRAIPRLALNAVRGDGGGAGASSGGDSSRVPQPSALPLLSARPQVPASRAAALLDAGVVKIRVPKLLQQAVRAMG